MKTASDIISLWPSAEHFAADLGLKYPSHGRVMKMRGRIPARYFDQLLEAADRRNITISRADLMQQGSEPAEASAA